MANIKLGGGGAECRLWSPPPAAKGLQWQFHLKMNAPFFAQFIRDHFNVSTKHCGRRLFVKDNDSSQRKKAAIQAPNSVEAKLLKINALSPNFDSIENVFQHVKRALRDEAIKKSVSKLKASLSFKIESYKEHTVSCYQ